MFTKKKSFLFIVFFIQFIYTQCEYCKKLSYCMMSVHFHLLFFDGKQSFELWYTRWLKLNSLNTSIDQRSYSIDICLLTLLNTVVWPITVAMRSSFRSHLMRCARLDSCLRYSIAANCRTNHINPDDQIIFKVLEPSEFEAPTPFFTLSNHYTTSGVQFPAT